MQVVHLAQLVEFAQFDKVVQQEGDFELIDLIGSIERIPWTSTSISSSCSSRTPRRDLDRFPRDLVQIMQFQLA